MSAAKCIIILIFCAAFSLIGTSFVSAIPGWRTFSLRTCDLSLSYPSNWTTVSQSAKDRGSRIISESAEGFEVSAPEGFPKFSVSSCSDGEPEYVGTVGLIKFANQAIDFETGQTNPMSNVSSEGPSIDKTLISGHEVVVFSLIYKFNNGPPDLKMENYVLKNGYRMYGFMFVDASRTFDSPENKEIRRQILQSITFP